MVRNSPRPLLFQLSSLSGKISFPDFSTERSQAVFGVAWLILIAKSVTPVTVAKKHPRPELCAQSWGWGGEGNCSACITWHPTEQKVPIAIRGEWCLMSPTPTHVCPCSHMKLPIPLLSDNILYYLLNIFLCTRDTGKQYGSRSCLTF